MLRASLLRSSTLRFALICIALFSGGVFALFGYVYWSTASFVQAWSDRAIAAEYAVLLQDYDRGGHDALAASISWRIAERRQERYLLADDSFARVVGDLDAWPKLGRDGAGFMDFTGAAADPQSRPPNIRAKFGALPDGYHLLVGHNTDELGQLVAAIKTSFVGAIVLMFTLAGAASLSVSRRTVGRIEAINATTREIMRSGLSSRIPVRGTKDEWDQLSENLNSMLDRIEKLMQEIKQVSDNIAHDLRTPLSRMRGHLERASRQGRDADAAQALVRDTISELDSVLMLFSAILRIARLEAHEGAGAFRMIDLSKIASEVAELFDAAAEAKGGHVELVAVRPVWTTGDRDLLFDALANLVDNALKHGSGGGEVKIEVLRRGDCPVLSVCDHGPGIPADELKHVLKRFYRLERSRSAPGNGLGLSLVAAVAQLHGAELQMSGNRPGLRVELRFPPPKVATTAAPQYDPARAKPRRCEQGQPPV